MPTTQIAPSLVQSFKDSNGNPLAGGLLYTFIAGTSTPQTTYTDATGTAANTNPVVLNSRGEAPVWLTIGQSYKFVLYDAFSTLIYSVDQIASTNPIGTPIALSATGITGAAASGANSDITSLSAVTSINGGQLAGLRNAIINGNFGINQRAVTGTVVLAAGAYGHDRFKAGAGGCTYTFATALNITTITISAGTLQQVIEGGNLQSGSYKLSFVGTATARVDAGAYGASGAAVTGTAVGGTNQTVEFGTGTVSKVQYELGTTATTFEQRPVGLELALCQRYLPAVIGNVNDPVGAGYCGATNTNFNIFVLFKQTPRIPPTGIVFSNTLHFNINTTPGGGAASGLVFNNAGLSGANLTFNGSAGTSGSGCYVVTNIASAVLLFTGCEL